MLQIIFQKQNIEIVRFLYNLVVTEDYRGLGHYFMGFIKSIATSSNPQREIHIKGYGDAEKIFYNKEGVKVIPDPNYLKYKMLVWGVNQIKAFAKLVENN